MRSQSTTWEWPKTTSRPTDADLAPRPPASPCARLHCSCSGHRFAGRTLRSRNESCNADRHAPAVRHRARAWVDQGKWKLLSFASSSHFPRPHWNTHLKNPDGKTFTIGMACLHFQRFEYPSCRAKTLAVHGRQPSCHNDRYRTAPCAIPSRDGAVAPWTRRPPA